MIKLKLYQHLLRYDNSWLLEVKFEIIAISYKAKALFDFHRNSESQVQWSFFSDSNNFVHKLVKRMTYLNETKQRKRKKMSENCNWTSKKLLI